MLEPREADIPILFLVLVVLPVVIYILLGKWSEASEKRGRINFLSQMEAEEAHKSEAMAAASKVLRHRTVDVASGFLGAETMDAATGSLRAESVAAASGVPVMVCSKSKELHVCARCLSPAKTRCSRCKSIRYCSGKCQIIHWRLAHKDECVPVETYSASTGKVAFDEESVSLGGSQVNSAPQVAMQERISVGKRHSCKSNRESYRKDSVRMVDSTRECSGGEAACAGSEKNSMLKEGHVNTKSGSKSYAMEENPIKKAVGNSCMQANGQPLATSMQASYKQHSQHASDVEGVKQSGEHQYTESSWKAPVAAVSKTVPRESNGISTMGIMKMMGLRRSTKLNTYEHHDHRHKNLKMLFPYEEFVRLFQSEVLDLSPRGLVNCGNSCYANAVLQALTCTKPLVVYLLQRSHSRSCRGKDWCLLCELEQHVMMLRENGGPLSASRILSHMRSINCQIGDGSQEDAHEFLRLLVASMQSICLERLGGESKVDPRLQETTLVQHMFGGRLRSKVKCLRCGHESERYENIMDLTLEIYGWVESLQDALTQFTTPEDLDGENMYRCSRCAGYVQARKQLSVHEAPNILTIVLKRFQEGRYGKINKCITFPEMLDMNPFMSRTGEAPPLYMLYAVVVHLDTLNASFSGHYISYVKDLCGNWFRIDDSEIHRVPMSQVMSEGAYMLFYMRSNPRDQNGNARERQYESRHKMKPSSHIIGRSEAAASSSDWSSLFTSSDEGSFTTESTRDSFSTIDYSDACHSIFDNLYPSPHNTVACRMFSGTKAETRYFLEETRSQSNNVVDSSSEDYYRNMYVNYQTNLGDQTFSYGLNW